MVTQKNVLISSREYFNGLPFLYVVGNVLKKYSNGDKFTALEGNSLHSGAGGSGKISSVFFQNSRLLGVMESVIFISSILLSNYSSVDTIASSAIVSLKSGSFIVKHGQL